MHVSLLRGLILSFALGGPLVLAQAPASSPTEATDAAQGVIEAASSSVPPNDSDLAQIQRDAQAILALANDCKSKPCPVVETCEAAGRLLQAMNDAQAYLEAMETALNRGAAAASAAHNNVVAQTRITSTNLKIAMEALAVQEYLSRFAQLMFDLASLSDDLKTMAEKGTPTPGDNTLQKLDTAYETLKDGISVVNDMGQVVNDVAPPPGATGEPGPTLPFAPVGGGWSQITGQGTDMANRLEDVKSSMSDAANAIDEVRKDLKDGKPIDKANLIKAAGKIAFRELKAEVDRQIEALKKYIAELEKNLAAEEKVLAGLFRERMRMNARRAAATDARQALAQARNALIDCLARTCGLPSLTRPTIPNYYAAPAGMSASQLARHHGWGNALKDLGPKLAGAAARLRELFVVKNICPGEGGTFADPGGGGIGTTGGVGTTGGTTTGGFPPRNRESTRCAPCQPIADAISRNLDEHLFREEEIKRIERRLAEAQRLRAELEQVRNRLATLDRYISELRDIIRQGQAFGISVAGQAEQNLALAEGQRVQLRGQMDEIQREIDAAEAERPMIGVHRALIESLRAQRRVLREQLAFCEKDQCRVGYFGELDTWINITGNDPLNPNNPLGGGGVPGTPPPGAVLATVSVTRPTGEGDAPGVFTIQLSRPAPPGGIFVTYRFEGSAVRGSDYQAVQVGAPVPAGATSVQVTVTPIEDTLIEGTETVQLTITPGEGYAPGVPSAAIMPLADNDAPPQPVGTLQFAQSSYSVAENGGNVFITVTRAGGSAGAVSVNYAAVPQTAQAGSDFQAVSGTITWAAGDTAGKTITVPIVDDNAVENTETFQVTLSSPGGGATLGTPAFAMVSIADNDVATGPCGASGSAWANNAGTYSCSGSCDPSPSSQSLTVNGDRVTVNPFHAGGGAVFQGCGNALPSQSNTLVYFGQANHRATLTRTSDRSYNAAIQSSGGGQCAMSCSR